MRASEPSPSARGEPRQGAYDPPSFVQIRITPQLRSGPLYCGGTVEGPAYTSMPPRSLGDGSRSRLNGVGSGTLSRNTASGHAPRLGLAPSRRLSAYHSVIALMRLGDTLTDWNFLNNSVEYTVFLAAIS